MTKSSLRTTRSRTFTWDMENTLELQESTLGVTGYNRLTIFATCLRGETLNAKRIQGFVGLDDDPLDEVIRFLLAPYGLQADIVDAANRWNEVADRAIWAHSLGFAVNGTNWIITSDDEFDAELDHSIANHDEGGSLDFPCYTLFMYNTIASSLSAWMRFSYEIEYTQRQFKDDFSEWEFMSWEETAQQLEGVPDGE